MYGKTKKRPNKTMKNCPYPFDKPSARTHCPTLSPILHCFKKNCHFATFSHNYFCISISGLQIADDRFGICHRKSGKKKPMQDSSTSKRRFEQKVQSPWTICSTPLNQTYPPHGKAIGSPKSQSQLSRATIFIRETDGDKQVADSTSICNPQHSGY